MVNFIGSYYVNQVYACFYSKLLFSILSAPMNVIMQIESIIRGFLWADNMIGVKKIPLISLNEMAIDKSSGGVNLPNLQSRNKSFGAKLVWLIYEREDAKWCNIMQWK